MGRGQNKSSGKDGSGQRKETKEERRIRLEKQAEAREKCFQLLPYAGGVIFVLLVLFAVYVNSVPPPPPRKLAEASAATASSQQPDHCGGGGGGGSGSHDIPEFMYVDTTLSPAGQARREAELAAAASAAEFAESTETIDLE